MKKFLVLVVLLMASFLMACNDDDDVVEEEPVPLEVEFNVPETVEVGETVTLEAIVTYGDDYVEDADEVEFEYWIADEEDGESVSVEGEHVADGSYQAEVEFEEATVYEMYAHTTAEGLHTMPLESITVEDPE